MRLAFGSASLLRPLGQLRLRQGLADDAKELLAEAIRNLEEACKHRPSHVRDRRSRDDTRRMLADMEKTARVGDERKP
jgi:hypothetical protein